MNKYRRIIVEKEKKDVPENEIRVTARGRTTTYISYASKIFNEKALNDLTIAATGTALATAVTIAEILKRRFKGLHQITKVGSLEITDEYEPLEEGLDNVTDVRSVSFIEIILSKVALDTKDKGYQSPLPDDQVQEVSADEMIRGRGGRGKGERGSPRSGSPKERGSKGSKGRGRSKGKGKGKGKSSSPSRGKKGEKGVGKSGKRGESPKGKPSKGKGKGGKGSKSKGYESEWGYRGYESEWGYDGYESPKGGKGKGKGKGKSSGKGKGKGGKSSGKGKGKGKW